MKETTSNKLTETQNQVESKSFINEGKVILENLEYLVFDEADKYFELNLAY